MFFQLGKRGKRGEGESFYWCGKKRGREGERREGEGEKRSVNHFEMCAPMDGWRRGGIGGIVWDVCISLGLLMNEMKRDEAK